MGDLHSIAFSSSLHSSSLGLDFHNLGVFNADISHCNHMESSTSSSTPSLEAVDLSTGYLQDVLFGFSTKRRRLLLFPHEQTKDLIDNSIRNCWTSNFIQNCCENFDTMSEITKCDTSSDIKTPEEAISATYDSSSSSHTELIDTQWTPDKQNLCSIHHIFSSGANEKRRNNKRVLAKVVYPFALVKPGGFEGNMTLNDINERILMPPTRAVRHPVGDFACRPLVSPDGPGLSGKSVVAFTRIHTQGRGSITIIRTRN